MISIRVPERILASHQCFIRFYRAKWKANHKLQTKPEAVITPITPALIRLRHLLADFACISSMASVLFGAIISNRAARIALLLQNIPAGTLRHVKKSNTHGAITSNPRHICAIYFLQGRTETAEGRITSSIFSRFGVICLRFHNPII